MPDNSYSWLEFIQDLFSVSLLTLLSFVMVELLRPGVISARLNLFYMLIWVGALGLYLVLSKHRLDWSQNFHLYIYVIVGLLVIGITIFFLSNVMFLKLAVGLIIFGGVLLILTNGVK